MLYPESRVRSFPLILLGLHGFRTATKTSERLNRPLGKGILALTRYKGAEGLQEAIDGFGEALKEYRKENVPLNWA